jgi:hypothetical protein
MILNWRSSLHDFNNYHLSAFFYFEKRMDMSVSVMRTRFFEMGKEWSFMRFGDDVSVVQYVEENCLGLAKFQWR